MLGVPPAFVLSQDQTLHRVVSPTEVSFSLKSGSLRIARNYCLRFIVLSDFSKYNADLISKTWIDQGFQFFLPFLFSHCSVFKMQLPLPLEVFSSSGDLFIIPHFRVFVKPFFKLFQVFSSLSFAKAFGSLFSLSSLTPVRLVRVFSPFASLATRLKDYSFFPMLWAFRTLELRSLVRQLYYYTTIFRFCQAEEKWLFPFVFVKNAVTADPVLFLPVNKK